MGFSKKWSCFVGVKAKQILYFKLLVGCCTINLDSYNMNDYLTGILRRVKIIY